MKRKTLKVKVTQEHIDQGIPGSWSGCPLALAIKHETGWEEATVAYPNLDRLRYEYCSDILVEPDKDDADADDVRIYSHSLKSARFVVAFDAKLPVKPTTFQLRRVDGEM